MLLTLVRLSTKPFYLTTPIFYVNAVPHIGHLYTALLADAQHRFQRLLGRDSFLSTGTDEHGIKIERVAREKRVEPSKYCADVSRAYRDLFDDCQVDYTDFIRTTEDRHVQQVQKLWDMLLLGGYVRKSAYRSWYCVPDETFLSDSQTSVRPEDGVRVSLESGHPVEWAEEENYVFNIGSFSEKIKHWLDEAGVIRPVIFRNQINRILEGEDRITELSISRPRSRITWGIPVPGDPEQLVYVWLDALANYITVGGKEFWPADIHVVGKDILKFHAVYWPAFLMAAGLELPKRIFVHSHWMVNDEKMSKSKGNVIDPRTLIKQFTVDGTRYFLLREGVPHSDGNFSEKKMVNYLNAELANTLGNLLSRCTAKTVNVDQMYPSLKEGVLQQHCSVQGKKVLATLEGLADNVERHYLEFEYYLGINLVMEVLRETNLFIQEEKPWELKTTNLEHLSVVLHIAMESLRISGILLQPIMPSLCANLLDKLNVRHRQWENAKLLFSLDSCPIANNNVILFKKIKS